jgi:hypothetical protein
MGPLSEWTALPRLNSCGGLGHTILFLPGALPYVITGHFFKIYFKRPFYASRWEKKGRTTAKMMEQKKKKKKRRV